MRQRAGFQNGQAVFEEEWKPKFVDREEGSVQAGREKRGTKAVCGGENLEVEVMSRGTATTGSRIPTTNLGMRFFEKLFSGSG